MVNDETAKEKKSINTASKKLPQEISQEILKNMFDSLLTAVGIMLYFIILNLAYSTMKQERLIEDIKVFAGVFLVVGIVLLEKSYKSDSGSKALKGIETLILSLHSLLIMHVITLFQYNFQYYLLTSSYIFSIYYVFKAIVLYTKGRRDYLSSLSDISEIVKREEPIKKEAKKRQEKESDGGVNHTKKRQLEKKKSTKTKMNQKKRKNTTRKKATSSSSNKTVKKENVEESKKVNTKSIKTAETNVQEKKKRGRPKKEVTKND